MADQRQLSQLRAELDEVKAATNAQSVADVVTAIARQAEVAQDLADMRSQVEQEHERLQEEEQALQTQLADLRCLLLGERLSVWHAFVVKAVSEVCCELFVPLTCRRFSGIGHIASDRKQLEEYESEVQDAKVLNMHCTQSLNCRAINNRD